MLVGAMLREDNSSHLNTSLAAAADDDDNDDDCCSASYIQTHTNILTYQYTHMQVFIRMYESRKPHLQTCHTSQLSTTSQHHSPTQILPRNIQMLEYMPTQCLPTPLRHGLVH